MSKLPMIARYLLGLVLVIFGSNGFLNFLPAPEFGGGADSFIGAIFETGYLWYLVKGTEVIVGILLLAGRFVPLALVLLGPISVNIVAFHIFLAPADIGPAALVFILNLYLLFAHKKDAYAPLLKATPDAASE